MRRLIPAFLSIFWILYTASTVFAASAPPLPSVEAKGAILVDVESGRILWGKNAYEPLAMASTTKIMTAVLALENGNLDDIVTVSRRAAAAPKVKMFLTPGERIPLRVLLYALMLQSSNDAAVAIAEHLGGTVEDFCRMMTEKARELGAKDTVFESPNGLDAGDHHSTAYDLAVIARYALENQEFVKIINTGNITGKSDKREYTIVNKNRLLNEFKGANGIKTGFTGKAGHCFVGSAKRDGLYLISVVLASGWGNRGREQKWVDTKRIMNFGFDNYFVESIISEGDEAGGILVERSKTPQIGAVYSESLSLPLNAYEKETMRLEASIPESIRAPINAGDKLGVCGVYLNGEKYTEIDIIAASSADRHDLKTSMEKVLVSLLKTVSSRDLKVVLPEFY